MKYEQEIRRGKNMKIGIDLGNSNLKSHRGVLIPSKIKQGKYINKSVEVVHERKIWTIGEGNREVEINKAKKENNLLFLYTMIALSSQDIENEVAVGLPIGQYQEQREQYREYILNNSYTDIVLNGEKRIINITNCKVCAEGLASVPSGYEGIILDIGGKTTDIVEIRDKRILNPVSKAKGTLNLYSNIVNSINSKYSLDLVEDDAERIIKNGLFLDGEQQNIDFIYNILSTFTDDIVNTLKLEYSLRTNKLLLIGGGGELFYNAIKKRAKQAVLIDDSIFSNAKGFRRALE